MRQDPQAQAPRVKEVSSPKNPLIREVLSLSESAKARREAGRFIVEGLRELGRAIEAGWVLETALFPPHLITLESLLELIHEAQARQRPSEPEAPLKPARPPLYVSCAPSAFERVAYRGSVANAVGVFCARPHSLESYTPQEVERAPLYLVAEGVEKPGNLGALLRTASAMGVTAVLLCEARCDLYHPNVLRNSLGGAFDLPVISCESEEAISWLKAQGVQLVTTYLEGASQLETLELTSPTALVVGAEDRGVTLRWVEASDALALIPMQGVVDSLNVSVAAGMALFEATRQRRAQRGD